MSRALDKLLAHFAVGFEPILTGVIVAMALPILAMSLVNATVEEAIFRRSRSARGHPRGGRAARPLAGRRLARPPSLGAQRSVGSPRRPGALLLGIGSVYFGKRVSRRADWRGSSRCTPWSTSPYSRRSTGSSDRRGRHGLGSNGRHGIKCSLQPSEPNLGSQTWDYEER